MNPPEPAFFSEEELVSIAVRKATRRLVPFLLLLYVLAFLDRVNVSYAKQALSRDIGLGETAYAFGAGVFFVAYALLELPSNLLLKMFGARIWLSRIMITWGLVSALTMFVRTGAAFCALRFLLGAAEAGFFPGVIYYLTLWFPDRARASAFGLFYFGAPLAQIGGGPLSGMLLELDGAAGLKGWQWLFLIEGAMAIVAGFWAIRRLTDRPSDAAWLTDCERGALGAALGKEERVKAGGEGRAKQSPLRAPGAFRLGLIYLLIQISVYGITFYLPSMVAHLLGRENGLVVGIVSAIPWLCGLAAAYAIPRMAARMKSRTAVAGATLGIASAGIALSSARSPSLGLAALCLAVAGIIGVQPLFWTFPAEEFPAADAAAGIALVNSIGAVGSFIAPNLRAAAEAAFGNGFAGSLSVASAALMGSVLIWFHRPQCRQPEFS